jgi:hypothetical protein
MLISSEAKHPYFPSQGSYGSRKLDLRALGYTTGFPIQATNLRLAEGSGDS